MRLNAEGDPSRRSFIGGGLVGRFKTARVLTDAEIQAHALKLEHRRIRRRGILKGALWTGLMYKVAPNAIGELATGEYRANIGFMDGQEQRLQNKQTDSLCLVLGGANTRVAKIQAAPIAGELSHFGAVGYVKYAAGDPDVKGIADKIEKYQKKYTQLSKLSIYGVSLGTQIAGGVMEELAKRGNQIKLENLIMDSTPPDVTYTAVSSADPAVEAFNVIGGDPLVTGAANTKVWHNPFKPGSALPKLLAEQMVFLHRGKHYLRILARIAQRDVTRVGYLTPNNPDVSKDVDSIRSETTLRQDFFPRMETFKVSGGTDSDHREGHANPDQNGKGYRKALGQLREKWALAA